MNWEDQLITLYLLICKEYESKLWINCQRFTNGGVKKFSDEEVMTIYIFGTLMGFTSIKKIYRFAKFHLQDWFPEIPGYAAYVHRINRLHEAFRGLIETLQVKKIASHDSGEYLVDSFPIALAKNNHAYTARVAKDLASTSYNSTKKMYYHGIKVHVVARKRKNTLPDIEIIMLEEAETCPNCRRNKGLLSPFFPAFVVLLVRAYYDIRRIHRANAYNGRRIRLADDGQHYAF